jgi:Spy/CpxP family protein refolding chaperone
MKINRITALMLGIALIAPAQAAAQKQGALANLGKILAPLNLTPVQDVQLAALAAAEQPKLAKLRKALRADAENLLGAADTASASTAAESFGGDAKNLAIEVGTLRVAVEQILTPQQKAQLSITKVSALYKRLLLGNTGPGRKDAAPDNAPDAASQPEPASE